MNESNQDAYIGDRKVWGGTSPFFLSTAARHQHTVVAGATGAGKSTLLRGLFLADVYAGRGCGIIDPHGDLAAQLLDLIPRSRSRDVIFFNPADPDFSTALNLLVNNGGDDAHRTAAAILGSFKNLWSESWGPRLQYILHATLAALAECPNTSLLGVQRMLADEQYREWVLGQVRDPATRAFFLQELPGYSKQFFSEAVGPVQNKIGELLLSPLLRCVVGQVRRAFDPRWVMDSGKIFIATLSKGQLGELSANLLGSLLIAAFQQAALSRADQPEEQRRDFFLIIDEAHNLMNDSFVSILGETRKYHLSVTASLQHLGQIRQDIRDALLGNAGNFLAFRVGEADAAVLARQYAGAFAATEFTDLANFEVLVRRLDNGIPHTFRGTTAPPQGQFHGRRESLIRQSRQRYATPRAVVEDRIRRWMNRGGEQLA